MLGRSADYPGIILYKRMAPYKAHSANDKHSSPILQKMPPSIPKRLIICCFTSCVINLHTQSHQKFPGGDRKAPHPNAPRSNTSALFATATSKFFEFLLLCSFLIPDKKYLLSCRYWDSLDYEVLFLNLVLHM